MVIRIMLLKANDDEDYHDDYDDDGNKKGGVG